MHASEIQYPTSSSSEIVELTNDEVKLIVIY